MTGTIHQRDLSELGYKGVAGGGPTQSPPLKGDIPTFDVPILASGPDLLGKMENTQIIVLSDSAGLLRGFMIEISPFAILAQLKRGEPNETMATMVS